MHRALRSLSNVTQVTAGRNKDEHSNFVVHCSGMTFSLGTEVNIQQAQSEVSRQFGPSLQRDLQTLLAAPLDSRSFSNPALD